MDGKRGKRRKEGEKEVLILVLDGNFDDGRALFEGQIRHLYPDLRLTMKDVEEVVVEEEEGRRGGGDEEERQRWCPELQFFLYLVILWRGSIHTPLSPPHLNSRRLHFFSIIHKLFVFCCGAVQSRSQPF